MLELIVDFFQTPGATRTLVFVWTGVMICVPIVRWVLGEGAERIGIATGVFAQVVVVVVALAPGHGWWVLVPALLVPLLGWSSEVIGWKTGFPFGKYTYTDVLQPQVAGVPLLIPLAWLMMMPPAWAVGHLLAPDRPFVAWLLAALAFTSWDLYLDPQMVRWGFWKWQRHGAYLGIPVTNYLGWFGVSFVITAIVSSAGRLAGFTLAAAVQPLVIVFLVTWVLQFIGQFVFWKMRTAAIAGFLAMGAFVVALVLTV